MCARDKKRCVACNIVETKMCCMSVNVARLLYSRWYFFYSRDITKNFTIQWSSLKNAHKIFPAATNENRLQRNCDSDVLTEL